jgi:hypothetical protein
LVTTLSAEAAGAARAGSRSGALRFAHRSSCARLSARHTAQVSSPTTPLTPSVAVGCGDCAHRGDTVQKRTDRGRVDGYCLFHAAHIHDPWRLGWARSGTWLTTSSANSYVCSVWLPVAAIDDMAAFIKAEPARCSSACQSLGIPRRVDRRSVDGPGARTRPHWSSHLKKPGE